MTKKANKKNVIAARYTDDEYAEILLKITDENGELVMSPGEFSKHSTLTSKVTIVDSDLERYRTWVAASIGNNVNQIARRLNTDSKGGILSDSTYLQMAERLDNVYSELQKLLQPLR